ncbi:hypothetical protein [Pseudoalteromonas denitrificans]|uniref:Lipoprotein n=1 Tax=Pseudoalteromonas denitrificans DSM 6059 TaxID=1123010 RepID=A0A1I1RXC3_9GAMM|nr:hypothetical protein [Pseudoalteromonas denitrificans]SFD38901.1 hypothetical protein SAMN02745724_04378 [Pseudoalteromonas denitrificans DSM 6059]
MKVHILIFIVLLFGCDAIEADKKPEPLTGELVPFNWLLHADSKIDVQTAAAKNDYRLLAISARGTQIPGINASEIKSLMQVCNYRFLKGMGDVISSPEYRQWWKKGMTYAKDYNLRMAEHCKKNVKH